MSSLLDDTTETPRLPVHDRRSRRATGLRQRALVPVDRAQTLRRGAASAEQVQQDVAKTAAARGRRPRRAVLQREPCFQQAARRRAPARPQERAQKLPEAVLEARAPVLILAF